MVVVLSRDIVAADAHYHRSCYRDYVRQPPTSRRSTELDSTWDGTPFDVDEYHCIEQAGFKSMFTYIRQELFTEPRIISMAFLMSKVTEHMTSMGIVEIKDSTKKHLRRKLEVEFKETLHIFSDESSKLLVMPDNMSIYQLAKENAKMTHELEQLHCDQKDENCYIDKAATHIRSVIKENNTNQEYPHMPSSLHKESMSIPTLLKRLYLGILTGQPELIDVPERIQWLIESFAQDLIYAVSSGKQKPPKHILLVSAIKTLTGNVQLTQALNRLGHCVSYWQVEENATALCLKKLAATEDGRTVLPENIFPYVFTTMAWDNIDILEETRTGVGTSHRVNGIIVQPTMYGPQQQQQQCMPITGKRKQRSIFIDDIHLPTYNSGQRIGPGHLVGMGQDCQEVNETAFVKNLLWVLLRLVDQENQKISSWTGFHITIRKGLPIKHDTVGYLPTINAPATDMATVFEILSRSASMMKDLHVQNLVLVFDQALYEKVAEVLWKNKDRYQGIIIRMGAFHTLCNQLSILGKRFQDAGLRDLCIESGILAEGSISGVMDGKHYNRAVRIHKYIYEALMRLAWKGVANWLDETHPDKQECSRGMLTAIENLHEHPTKEAYDETLSHEKLHSTLLLFQEYLDHLRKNSGALSAYWMSYVDMVGGLLLGLLRASREGDWSYTCPPSTQSFHGALPMIR